MMWENIYIEGAIGSENGLILEDEEYANSCRITVEKCPHHFAITCGIYGAMVHTVFCGENYKEIYDSMKKELQDFIDRDTTVDEEHQFYNDFTTKF